MVPNAQQRGRVFPNAQQRGGEVFSELPSTPVAGPRSSSQRKNGDADVVSPSELSPGILDLHSLDTELLSDVRI